MVLSHNKALYDELFWKIARMHDEVDYRRHLNSYHGRGGKWKTYPCVSVGAELVGVYAIGHHRYVSREEDFHPLVYTRLITRLGELNGDSVNYPACRNKVGHCAENYAASGVLVRIDSKKVVDDDNLLNHIQFTKAFQPRTWKNLDWCANCHTMFD